MDDKNIELSRHVEDVSQDTSPHRLDHVYHHEEDRFELTFNKFLAITAFVFGLTADIMILTMVSSALGPINKALGPDPNYSWMAVSQTIGTAALAVPMGRFGDIFGRRNILIGGSILSLIGCVIAATAQSVNTVIVGVTFTGVGCSMHQVSWTCFGEIVPKKHRPLAFGVMETVFGLASAFSPVIAYSFVAEGYFRGIFWVPFAMQAVSIPLVFFFYRPMNQYIKEAGKTRFNQLMECDFIGTFLFVVGSVLFLVGLSFGGGQYPWVSAGTLAPILIGIAMIVALGVYEAKANIKYPCFPPQLFSDFRGFTVVLVGIFLYGILYYATAVIWPTQVGVLYSQKPMTIGWYSMAVGLGGLWGGLAIGQLFRKLGHTNITFSVSLLILTVLSGAQAIVSPTSHVASTVLVILNGAFIAGVSVETVTLVQFSTTHEFIGVATGIATAIRGIGGAVGQTVYLAILQNKLKANIPSMVALPLAKAGVAPATLPQLIEELLGGIYNSPLVAALTPAQILVASNGIKNAYASSFRLIYLVSIAFGAVAIIAACFTKNQAFRFTNTIAITLVEGAHVQVNTDTGEGHFLGKHDDEVIFGDDDVKIGHEHL